MQYTLKDFLGIIKNQGDDFMAFLSEFNHIHFIGIGGVSMSALAEIALFYGCKVSGSDRTLTDTTHHLASLGAAIFEGHSAHHIKSCDLVVFTSAICETNPEYLAAKEKNIPTLSRAEFLGKLMKEYTTRIAVSGTHGKTTTTGMLSTLLSDFANPTVLLGGMDPRFHGNVKIGETDLFLTEACEYRENFLNLMPNYILMLNVEWDHPDYYPSSEAFEKAFFKFAKKLTPKDTLLYHEDDPTCRTIAAQFEGKKISFGKNPKSTLQLLNITSFEDYTAFQFSLSEKIYTGKLNALGTHNVYNALAAILAAWDLGMPMEQALESLSGFRMTKRRLNFLGKNALGVLIYDDYGHHPTAVSYTIDSLRKIAKGALWVVFEPHTYSRIKVFLNGFVQALKKADQVIIAPIYAARESEDKSIYPEMIAEKINQGGTPAKGFNDFESILSYLGQNLKEEDILVTIGAGNVRVVAERLLAKNK